MSPDGWYIHRAPYTICKAKVPHHGELVDMYTLWHGSAPGRWSKGDKMVGKSELDIKILLARVADEERKAA
jgi:hypothetical protein